VTLRVTDLSKTFGTTKALDLLSFSVSGGVVALLGSNGSGKSTLLRILATALPPDSGTITYDGLHYGRDTRWLRQHISIWHS
jgi:ABC-2 type transport system ATP-binding protein